MHSFKFIILNSIEYDDALWYFCKWSNNCLLELEEMFELNWFNVTIATTGTVLKITLEKQREKTDMENGPGVVTYMYF